MTTQPGPSPAFGPAVLAAAGLEVSSPREARAALERVREAVRAESGAGDGVGVYLGAFVRLVDEVLGAGSWNDAAGVERLVVEWVRAGLAAIRSRGPAATVATPRCWALLFDRRGDAATAPVVLAALGVNAAVGYDLGTALSAAGSPAASPGGPSADVLGVARLVVPAVVRGGLVDGPVPIEPGQPSWSASQLRLLVPEPDRSVLDDLDVVVAQGVRRAWDEAAARGPAPADVLRSDSDRLARTLGLGLLAGGPASGPDVGVSAQSTFRARDLYGSRIATPLLEALADDPTGVHRVMIDLNRRHPGGHQAAVDDVHAMLDDLTGGPGVRAAEGVDADRSEQVGQYVVANLTGESVRALVSRDGERTDRAIFRVWPDFKVRAQTNRSAATVKVDAARATFAARGAGIVWAVLDSGVDGSHPHLRDALAVAPPLAHADYTGAKSPLTDDYGHGTHVAGIIAGSMVSTPERPILAVRAEIDADSEVGYAPVDVAAMSGMAPDCRIVSMKVLDATGDGEVSAILAALQDIARINDYGRDLKIHGVNLSVGYPFDPKWFACGESPICLEVTRLVRSGVVVVVAAGNTGYGFNQVADAGVVAAGMDVTVNDPGNTELAITVGSTHREAPYRYGVSYFSSKGPTGDGRAKPDVVAPGERILSCAAGKLRADLTAKLPGTAPSDVHYVEDSGTSMAAAHVSGLVAAFLSVRPEFVGLPERVKEIVRESAGDLGRVPTFQGRGLVDLMRALQSV